MINEIPEKNYFWLYGGGVLKNLEELEKSLENMSDEVFRHHVNETKNDFSNWIRDVFLEKELAEKIGKTKDKKEIKKILKEAINKGKETHKKKKVKKKEILSKIKDAFAGR